MSTRWLLTLTALTLAACSGSSEPTEPAKAPEAPAEVAGPDAAALRTKAAAVFKPLPEYAVRAGEAKPSDAVIDLGRALYYEERLSINDTQSCNSCHDLARYGVDHEPLSPGAKGELGGRNSPTSLNAAVHTTQFWDGREPDVEAQAKGPVLNPVEMGMPDAAAVEAKLRGIPAYGPMFAAAFPGEAQPITFDNMAIAIGAFERGLMTPSPLDAFLKGDDEALSAEQLAGMQTFMDVGCTTCHNGVGIGGNAFFKMGLVKPYETQDLGRFDVTQNEADKYVFKVPSLRNITQTGPYLHDGSVSSLEEVVKLMGVHQLGKELTGEQVQSILAFLGALEGSLNEAYAKAPTVE